MITYHFGDKDCKLDFKDFLSITTDIKKYKSEFDSFSKLYEFIETHKKEITHILFYGYEYFIENGVLHNLYGPAYIRYNDPTTDRFSLGSKSIWFYINGKLVQDNLNTRGCKKLQDFQNGDIFFFRELTYKKSNFNNVGPLYRRKEGVDYIKDYINLENLTKIDQRYKKLKMLKNVS